MYSSEDLEKFYFQFKTEALPLGMSIEAFCLKNKVPYNIFSKWHKDTRKKVVEVHVDVNDAVNYILDDEKAFKAFLKNGRIELSNSARSGCSVKSLWVAVTGCTQAVMILPKI